ncbi:hypothetical protein BDR06DRAFT_981633 [Suillus hirtellus]|nr:hypothetical protein BDR06DRAFT_981633 [Suillus hirtellus]
MNAPSTNWTPYQNRVEFETAEFLFTRNQMSAKQIDMLLDLWATTLIKHNNAPPFANHKDIDPLELVRNMLANPDFDGEIEFSPYHDYTTDNKQYWKNLMLGDLAWNQADLIAQNQETHDSTFMPLIMGSDKTIVSVTTGHTEYHPPYLLISNIVNSVCLADSKDLDSGQPCLHRHEEHTELLVDQLTHKQLWSEYGIISDLILFTNDFPRADIHELLSPDLLHQIIKGTFKDHLLHFIIEGFDWVEDYLTATHGAYLAAEIMDDIDRRIAAVAPFTGLQHFPDGRGFKQWTGDDSKALMKVYIPAIKDHVPEDITCAFSMCLDFCYLVQCKALTENNLVQLQEVLECFHEYREIFKMTVKEPWCHSSRFKALGQMLLMNQCLDKVAAACADFEAHGMLCGLPGCLQVHKPQNQSVEGDAGEVLDEPTAESHIELGVTPCESVHMSFNPSSQYLECILNIKTLGLQLDLPHFPGMIQEFLHDQLHSMNPNPPHFNSMTAPIFLGKVTLFNSAAATFYALSDLSGTGGMRHEYIRSTPSWQGGPARHDCIFINMDADADYPMGRLSVVQVLCLFSFQYWTSYFPCAVVCWYSHILKSHDPDMGMYIVTPETTDNGTPDISIVHIDCVFCTAYLIPVYSTNFIAYTTSPHDSYNTFDSFYVNKYVDHHAFEIA